MATTDTSADSLFEHRLSMIIDQGFNMEDALTLVRTKKVVIEETPLKKYEIEVPITWHDVAKLREAGATPEQVMAILT